MKQLKSLDQERDAKAATVGSEKLEEL